MELTSVVRGGEPGYSRSAIDRGSGSRTAYLGKGRLGFPRTPRDKGTPTILINVVDRKGSCGATFLLSEKSSLICILDLLIVTDDSMILGIPR